MQLSNFSKRILQIIICILIVLSISSSFFTRKKETPTPARTAPEKLLMNSTCSTDNLKESINNFNCSLFLLTPQMPKKPLDHSYILETKKVVTLDDSYFSNSSLHPNENWIHADVEAPLKEMIEAAKKENVDLKIYSAFRRIETQKTYPNSLKVPVGRDENQTGFALDFTTSDSTAAVFQTGFSQSKEGIWLANNSYKFGFILRYPKDKDSITHVQFSPWHFRFIGKEIAKEMHDKDFTYEEWLKSKGVSFE